MSILIDLLPEKVEIQGDLYKIDSNFRTSILFELLMQDNSLAIEDKFIKALELYYPKIPGDIEAAIETIIWFYGCGKPQKQNNHGHESGRGYTNRVYSFDYDDDYIYAAFMSQYGIDLQDIDHLHWWKFRAMFKSLTDNNEFVKIMGYRSIEITSDMSKEQQSFYRKMQVLHKLPLPQDEEDKMNAITDALVSGGDLSSLL